MSCECRMSEKEELSINKQVTYYVVYTSIYFSILILSLFWSGGIYQSGKFHFQSILTIIIVAESTKYFTRFIHTKLTDINLNKKPEDKNLMKIIKTLLTTTKFVEGLKNVFTVAISSFIFFIVLILFGAEVFQNHEETFMLSVLLSVLVIFPVCINLGSNIVLNILVNKPNDKLSKLMYLNVQLTLFGTWLGAFVIPLDWDRPWQKWPIPCCVGAMLGFLLSHFIQLVQILTSKTKSKAR